MCAASALLFKASGATWMTLLRAIGITTLLATLRLPFAFGQLTTHDVHRRGLCRHLQKAEPFARHGVEHRRHRRRPMCAVYAKDRTTRCPVSSPRAVSHQIK
jgi:hypothetical protein